MNENPRKYSNEQIALMAAASVAMLGWSVWSEFRKSPSQRAKEADENRARHAARAEFDRREQRARKLDQEHWRAFETDAQAQAACEAEMRIQVLAEACTGRVSRISGGSLWGTWVSYCAESDEAELKLHHSHDGDRLGVDLKSPQGSYQVEGELFPDRIVIGTYTEAICPEHRVAASLLALLQANGHLTGRIAMVRYADYWQLRHRHYAAFATARGWPPERDGEVQRVWSTGRP